MTLYSMFFLFLLFIYYLYKRFSHRVPILMYHRIASIPGDRNALPPNKFAEQLSYLARNGFTTITPKMLFTAYTEGIPLPKKPILLTFDDGYVDNYTEAMPLLKHYKMNAVVFPIANWIGKDNNWENFHKKPTKTMTWNELSAWRDNGLQIEGHTFNHPFLTNCTQEQLCIELSDSRAVLESNLQMPIDFLCYPYGFFNTETVSAVKAAGYKGAFAIFDHVSLWKLNLYALPRIPIPSHQSMWEFRLKVSSLHLLFVAMRKWERNIKLFWRKK